MRACNEGQRRFVIAYLTLGYGSNAALAKAAGYEGDPDTLKVTGYRLMHNEKVLAAIEEEAQKRLKSAGIMAVSRLLELAHSAPEAKDQLKAIQMILNRTGMHEKTEHQVSVTHQHKAPAEIMERINFLAGKLGLDPKLLMGPSRPETVVVDAEFTEVTEPAEPVGAEKEDW